MTNSPERLTAALADRYRIERQLGEGGMATVYLADDLRHERKVALKVLKPDLAAVVGAERFLAEIKTTANLQHPHILPLFDSGEADGFLFYVMPYVEGESLRDRLDRDKQLPVDEAVRLVTEVADALQAAHDQGVIHRDVKPANILLSRGRPLVADFGIALAVSAAGGGRLTETGLSLGTPFYMSPEQASADREPTSASDVYSLACVLYEMLAGEPPYTGSSAQAVLARILTGGAPAVREARPAIPRHVDAAIRRALERLPADRFARVQDFAAALADTSFRHGGEAAAAGPGSAGPWRRVAFGAMALAIAASTLLAWSLLRSPPPGPVARFPSPFLTGQQWTSGGAFDIARDGSFLAYVASGADSTGVPRIWVRRFADLEATPVPGTEGATDLALSPDGTAVVFQAGSLGDAKVVFLQGGSPRILFPSLGSGRLFWGSDGYVYALAVGPLRTIRAAAVGGALETIIPPSEDAYRRWVTDILPGGKMALMWIDMGDIREVRVVELASGRQHTVTEGWNARYLAPDRLVFVDRGQLFVGPFDPRAGELRGDPVPVLQTVERYRLAANGTLVYSTSAGDAQEFVWVDLHGAVTPLAPGWSVSGLVERGFSLSPDERHLALSLYGADGYTDIWIKELPDGAMSRLTFAKAQAWTPHWLAGGERISYSVGRTGGRQVLSRRADGTGALDTLFDGSLDAPDAQVSGDGQWLVLRAGTGGGAHRHIAVMRLGKADSARVILGEGYNAVQPALSPDGRLLAYTSDESGRNEVYVRPFPNVGSGRVQVSTDGATQPRWSPDGQELYYVAASGMMTAARVASSPLRVGRRESLFKVPGELMRAGAALATEYDVAPQGGRFLMARTLDRSESGPGLVVVENWVSEVDALLRRTPAGR